MKSFVKQFVQMFDLVTIFQPGEHVFYNRNNENMWKGPGIVIGKENKQILVRHGGQKIRVHPCLLQLKSKNDQLNIQSVLACNLITNLINSMQYNQKIETVIYLKLLMKKLLVSIII